MDTTVSPCPRAAASDGTTGVYGITVAAELAGMSVQALRLYERKGLLQPHRTAGGTRMGWCSTVTNERRSSHGQAGPRDCDRWSAMRSGE
jgi:hypothetical protein